jgi:23S rRNA (cytosine1962-C5)-methyltransferase
MIDVVLQAGRERSLERRHPWLLSGAIARVAGEPAPGELVRVVSASGVVLGFGDYSPASTIRVRAIAFGKDAPEPDWLERRIEAAVARRAAHPLIGDSDALRLVKSEGDALPGLVVDRYAEALVVKLASVGMERRRDAIAACLARIEGARCGFERSDPTAARREGFAPRQGLLFGGEPPARSPIRERARRYSVDIVNGQKTGFYLDQRDARDLVERAARGRRVLDLFAYTGGFSAAAARGGASAITAVDSSAAALELAALHVAENAGAAAPRFEAHRADAFEYARNSQEPFDLAILDPPPLARSKADLTRASRAYKDLLMSALRNAAPGALVLAFSCSHHVGADLFRKIAFGASLDAQRGARVVGMLGAPADHPVSIDHPEGEYLTGLVLEV